MKLSVLFSDHMVLQRNKPLNLWGEGEGKVCVQLNGIKYYTVCDCGRWSVVIPPMPAGGPYELIISDCISSVTLKDVMIGEVWLAAGQSNMEHSLFSSSGGLETAKKMNNPNIRLFNVSLQKSLSLLSFGFEKILLLSIKASILVPPKLQLITPTATFSDLCSKSENIPPTALKCSAVCSVQSCHGVSSAFTLSKCHL